MEIIGEIIITLVSLYLLTSPIVIILILLSSDFLDENDKIYKIIKLIAKFYTLGMI